MIVEGQIHGGLAEGVGIALMEVITFDDDGNCLNGSFMDYLIPTALECPTSSSARRSRPARTTRLAPRASASRRTSARRRRSSTR
jgi:CO/xanthine dehydrogenase Mo-binding subunit